MRFIHGEKEIWPQISAGPIFNGMNNKNRDRIQYNSFLLSNKMIRRNMTISAHGIGPYGMLI